MRSSSPARGKPLTLAAGDRNNRERNSIYWKRMRTCDARRPPRLPNRVKVRIQASQSAVRKDRRPQSNFILTCNAVVGGVDLYTWQISRDLRSRNVEVATDVCASDGRGDRAFKLDVARCVVCGLCSHRVGPACTLRLRRRKAGFCTCCMPRSSENRDLQSCPDIDD